VRLQHSRSRLMYLNLLQAATVTRIVSGFRNATQKLRFAHRVSPTISTNRIPVSMGERRGGQGAKEHQSCCNYK
jgi:hypothetical protein